MNKIDKIVSGLFKLADKTDIIDNKNVLYLITGPTAAGKSTFRKSKTKFFVDEYPYDVYITKNNWWTKLFKYATKHKTNIIETHLLYQKNFNDWCVLMTKITRRFWFTCCNTTRKCSYILDYSSV